MALLIIFRSDVMLKSQFLAIKKWSLQLEMSYFDLWWVSRGHKGQKGQILENIGNGLKHVEN